jgi:hypothetical protein
MSRPTITVTQTTTRTYRPSDAELEELGLPTAIDALEAFDTDELGVALIDSELEDPYEVTQRDIEITPAAAAPGE